LQKDLTIVFGAGVAPFFVIRVISPYIDKQIKISYNVNEFTVESFLTINKGIGGASMKIKAVINSFSALAFGSGVSKKLIRDNRGYKIFLTIEKIGDICLELSYLKRYKQEHPDVKVAIATRSASNPLYKCFPDSYDKLIPITNKQQSLLLHFFHTDSGVVFRKKHPELTCLNPAAWVRRDFIAHSNNVNMGDIAKGALKLSAETLPGEINKIELSPEMRAKLDEQHIKKGKTVVINNVSYSCGGPSTAFFEELVQRLQDKGYAVVTNVVGDQQPVNGTKGLSFPLDEAVGVLDELGYVVGIRSGFLDLACFSDATVVAIDNDTYYASDAYLIEKIWPQKSNCRTMRYVENNTDNTEFINEIVSYIEKH